MSAYSAAIELTKAVLAQRARHYRRLIAAIGGCVALALLCAFFSAAVALSWAVVLPALVLTFVAADRAVVDRWQVGILGRWSDGDLRLDVLADTLCKVPMLPSATLAGMLGALPAWDPTDVPLALRIELGSAHTDISHAETLGAAIHAAACWLAALAAFALSLDQHGVSLSFAAGAALTGVGGAVERRCRVAAVKRRLCGSGMGTPEDGRELIDPWVRQLRWRKVVDGDGAICGLRPD